MSLFDFFKRKNNAEVSESINVGLSKTKDSFLAKLTKAIAGKSTVDDELLDELEHILISSDVGIATTIKIISNISERIKKDKYLNAAELDVLLKDEIVKLVNKNDDTSYLLATQVPYIIMVVGVNGVGKTTTIGKLSYHFKQANKRVLLGAADTFRAAAVDQLGIWASRIGVDIVMKDMGTDPSAVAFATLERGLAEKHDVIIIDTAGRLHNKINLMNELSKIKRVMQKLVPNAPHEVLLVLDGSTGQNAFEQAKHFTAATEVSALAVTKLDGSAKGGVVIGIADQFNIPVKYIGVGEKMTDLQLFNPVLFVDSILKK